MEKDKVLRCCICGNPIINSHGNNPSPARDKGRCCDDCNFTYVIPIRIAAMSGFFE